VNSDLILGVDIGGTKVAVVVAHPSGTILADLRVPTDLSGDSATLNGFWRPCKLS